MLDAPASARRRVAARVDGTVQGVGFRPYVYRLATELGLSGFVLNDSRGVLVEIEGTSVAVSEFIARLRPDAPALAVLERITVEDRDLCGDGSFAIRPSFGGGEASAPVTADTATCQACVGELFDPDDRRFRYPFINCTDCGPRFTIVRGVPYDRPLTTMAGFEMCPACRTEYDDPLDRRFHAQPNACPECGPRVSLVSPEGELIAADDPLRAAAAALRDGAIVAVKGVGGYHLACRADDEQAVSALRGRKHREDKPFALMAHSLAVAETLAALGPRERELLSGVERPIVLAARLRGAPVAASVAPCSPELGVMLPYSPLHHLLLADFARLSGADAAALVMTSGNVSDEPIVYRDEEAVQRLACIADLLLVHNRPIQTRTDDSVLRTIAVKGHPRACTLRRSRGYVPASLPLPGGTPQPLLACGAELKNTFCLAKGERAWVGHHIGDLENYETLRSFTEGIEHFSRLFAVDPAAIAHDMHPEYLSTKYARDCDANTLIGVQHHHAHLAACMAEHREPGPTVGAIFDGSGYGTDGTIWGGEILFGGPEGAQRVGKLLPVRLPGGERAIREPWRMACSWLTAALGPDPELPDRLAPVVSNEAWRSVSRLLSSGIGSPLTTSMGRLFDAIAAICGLRATVNYEGQAAIELEAVCDERSAEPYPFPLHQESEVLVLDPRPLVESVLSDVRSGAPLELIASRFHAAVAAVTASACVRIAADQGSETVVLSGGVFQNRRLTEQVGESLSGAGLRVLAPEALPANDGGIAFGQIAVAAARLRAEGGPG